MIEKYIIDTKIFKTLYTSALSFDEEHIKLLESFKKNQISKLLEQIETKIFEVLYSKNVSPRIARYFPRYELCFMSDETVLEKGKLYLRAKDGKIAYSVIATNDAGVDEVIKDAVLEDLDAPSPFKYKLSIMPKKVTLEKDLFCVRISDKGLEYTVLDAEGKTITDVIKKEELKVDLNSLSSTKDLEALMPKLLEIALQRKHTYPLLQYKPSLVPKEVTPEKDSFVVRMSKEGLEYTVLDSKGKLITDVIKTEELKIDFNSVFSPKGLEPLLPKILAITSKRNHTEPEIQGVTTFSFALMSDTIKPENGVFYVRILDVGLEYTVLNPEGKLVTAVIKKEELEIDLNSAFSLQGLELLLPEILGITSKKGHTLPFTLDAFRSRVLAASSRKGHTQWAPFKKYDLDPDNISQIKKLINALHYGRLTFLDLERVDVRKNFGDLKHLYDKTIDLAYEASYLLTHLDVDLKDIFSDELKVLLPLLGKVQDFAQNYAQEQKKKVKALQQEAPVAHKAGEVVGIAIDQMRPLGGDVDYNFLTQFSAVLPSYIDKLTLYIQQYSSQFKESEPKLNQEKLDELQNAALNLLNDIENLQGNSVFVSVKVLNYIHIICNIITLSMSSLEQIGELSESSQDLIRDKLSQLKYTVLPTLFGLVDKIEDNSMLKPGALSIPLMEKVKVLYDAITYLPKKVVDFQAKGAELLEIEDSRFVELRLEMSYKRIDKANKDLYRIGKADEACKQFFKILSDPLYKDFRLYQFHPEVKKELIKHYKLLKPYMMKLDIDLNELIITRLTGPEKESWYSYLGKPLRWARSQKPADHIDFVIEKQNALQDLITKDENSQIFHINLNKDLIDSVHKNTNLVLYPYYEKADMEDEAYKRFFESLGNPSYKNLRLYQFPPNVKKDLMSHYKLLIPYMIQLDGDLNELIVTQLTGSEEESWSASPRKMVSQIKNERPADHIRFVLAKQKELRDLLDATHKKTTLSFYSEKTNIYALDESIPLLIESEKEKKTKITKAEFQRIRDAYARFVKIINAQIAANPDLYEEELDLNNLEEQLKSECQNLYEIFQPYLGFIVPREFKDYEKYLVDFFAKKPIAKTPPTKLFQSLDKEIQDRFDRINYEWFNKAEFQTVLNAYKRFSDLIKEQIHTKPQLYGKNLLLTELDEQVKEECRTLYKIFQPYFKLCISPELKDAAQNFENYLAALLANKPLDILEAPPTSLFSRLDKNILDFFTKWQDQSARYYNLQKGQFLSNEESEALQMKRAKDAKLLFKVTEGNKTLENPEQLSANESLEVRQWYRNKINKLSVILKELPEPEDSVNFTIKFIDLLKEQITQNPKLQDNIMLLKKLDPKVKEEWRNLYNAFQPYFLFAVPPEKKQEALKLDQYLVVLLSNKKISRRNAPSVKTLLSLEEHLKEFFNDTHKKLNHSARVYYDLAQEKFESENEATPLQTDPDNGREHYVIPNTNYSKYITDFRKSLMEMTQLFNKAMQAELTPKTGHLLFPEMQDKSKQATQGKIVGTLKDASNTAFDYVEQTLANTVPFPEMEDDNLRLTQSKQVSAIKDIFNSLYHLESIIRAFEKLNNKSAKSIYVAYLLQAYGHLNEIIKLSKRLVADPHLGFIARNLVDKAQTLYATLQEQSDAYQVGPEQVPYGSTPVQYNSLWYVLNAFYISPKHIRAFKNNNHLTTEELNELHRRAKKATLFIEELINSSDSYFKLFLQTKNMVYLYQELTKKLNEFTSTAHDNVVYNLEKIRPTLLTPMLLEADFWEDRLGLEPGKLSGPLKQITDEFFKGFLHSLDLDSKTNIGLVCDKAPLEKRTILARRQVKNAKKYLKKIDREYQDIEDLYQSYLRYNDPDSMFPSDEEIQQNEQKLHAAYQKALPKLAKLKFDKKVEIATSDYSDDHKLDELCNAGLKDYQPHYTEIDALIKASHHHYRGVKATHRMRLKTAEEKLTHLTHLAQVQEEDTFTFVEKYTTEAFKKHLDALCNRYIGLQYTDQEYQAKLEEYLLNFKEEIITNAKTAKDINLSVKKQLKVKISAVEEKYYAEYYHLDSVRVALEQFKIYFGYSTEALQNKRSLFESEKTLKAKTTRIKTLSKIAENQALPIQERIKQIQTQVEDPNFSRIILAHRQVNTFSFAYIKLCFLSLLEALYLYTPTRKKLLDNIKTTVDNPPEISELTQRFGLFATASKAKDVEPKRYEAPGLPVTAPAV
ncbi:MAG: SdhA [Legionella sp.]